MNPLIRNLGKINQTLNKQVFNLITNSNKSKAIHTSNCLNSTQYYPINDDIFGLTNDQKEVTKIKKNQKIFKIILI